MNWSLKGPSFSKCVLCSGIWDRMWNYRRRHSIKFGSVCVPSFIYSEELFSCLHSSLLLTEALVAATSVVHNLQKVCCMQLMSVTRRFLTLLLVTCVTCRIANSAVEQWPLPLTWQLSGSNLEQQSGCLESCIVVFLSPSMNTQRSLPYSSEFIVHLWDLLFDGMTY